LMAIGSGLESIGNNGLGYLVLDRKGILQFIMFVMGRWLFFAVGMEFAVHVKYGYKL